MRSQDGIFGMGVDVPCFSMIQEMVYTYLKDHYRSLEMGLYYHTTDSFHVYERHFSMLDKIVNNEDEFEAIDIPRISGVAECDFLLDIKNVKDVPEEFKFTKWLLED